MTHTTSTTRLIQRPKSWTGHELERVIRRTSEEYAKNHNFKLLIYERMKVILQEFHHHPQKIENIESLLEILVDRVVDTEKVFVKKILSHIHHRRFKEAHGEFFELIEHSQQDLMEKSNKHKSA